MRGFKLVEKLPRAPNSSYLCILKTLADAFFHVRSGGNVEQTLINVEATACYSDASSFKNPANPANPGNQANQAGTLPIRAGKPLRNVLPVGQNIQPCNFGL